MGWSFVGGRCCGEICGRVGGIACCIEVVASVSEAGCTGLLAIDRAIVISFDVVPVEGGGSASLAFSLWHHGIGLEDV